MSAQIPSLLPTFVTQMRNMFLISSIAIATYIGGLNLTNVEKGEGVGRWLKLFSNIMTIVAMIAGISTLVWEHQVANGSRHSPMTWTLYKSVIYMYIVLLGGLLLHTSGLKTKLENLYNRI